MTASSFLQRQFKGWTKPGPLLDSLVELEEGETLDAISGGYRLYQFKDGHRFSTDDLLVAWYGTSHSCRAERVLDLGSGIGSVGMIAAWRLPLAKFVTIEAQEESVRLAEKSMRFNRLSERYEIRRGDFRDPKVLSEDEKFDLILGSPPYFPLGDGVLSEHPQKVACRFEVRGSVVDYCLKASRHLGDGASFFVVFPTAQEERTIQGARDAGLILVRSRAVVFKEGEPPLLTLYQMMLCNHLPDGLRADLPAAGFADSPLLIRQRDGKISLDYQIAKLSIGFPP